MQQVIFNKNKLKSINSTELLKGVSKTPLIILYLNNIKQIIEVKVNSGIEETISPLTLFGVVINKNQLDTIYFCNSCS